MKKLAFLALILSISACTSTMPSVTINNITYQVEIADETDERSLGLMNRQELAPNQGMLFIFNDERIRSFWMKNTYIPLDMIFINKNQEIVTIHENVRPCEEQSPKQNTCSSYQSTEPAKYVLEINAGEAKKNNLQVGDALNISY